MKLGLVSAILPDLSFEELCEFAGEYGIECLEVACWPVGKAERRYAGVSHIDVDKLDDVRVSKIKQCLAKNGVEISSLGYYPNPLDSEKGPAAVEHIHKLIDASKKLGVNLVTTFIGRDSKKNIEENLELVKEIWPPIIRHAEEAGVRIAIENCPMLFTKDEWPGGQNIMTTPANWRKVFDILDSPNLGINYDPSHFVWQMIDYIKPIYEFREKIFHVHYKDIKVYWDRLQEVGVMGYPLQFMSPKLPGLGDVDWGKYVSALTDIGYDGFTCIEIEDKAFEGSEEAVKKSIIQSVGYLRNFVS